MTSLPQLKALLERATPGEWSIDEDYREGMEWNNHIVSRPGHAVCFMANGGSDGAAQEGLYAAANLICALHNAAPELIAAAEENAILSKTVETLRARVAELEAQIGPKPMPDVCQICGQANDGRQHCAMGGCPIGGEALVVSEKYENSTTAIASVGCAIFRNLRFYTTPNLPPSNPVCALRRKRCAHSRTTRTNGISSQRIT